MSEAAQDDVRTRIGQAVMLHHAGDREEARGRMARLWDELGPAGDPLHRCTLAHYLADTQDDPEDELLWDLRALGAADGAPDAAVRGLRPSLHLNLAADYVKLGRPDDARRALARTREWLGELDDDAYGQGIRAAVARLELALDGARDRP